MSKSMCTRAAIGIAQFALACSLMAGPLNPPAGPITSTAKPHTPGDADSLFRITQPGSYYLTGNLLGVAGKKGIEVDASGVTIDLNGFKLQGVTGSLEGIQSLQNGASVRNGHVALWGANGVSLGGHARVEGVTASNNLGDGIAVSSDSLVTACVASENASVGIRALACCVTIVGCHVGNNFGSGIIAVSSTTIVDCTVTDNNESGIVAGSNAAIRRCVVTFNSERGITVSGDSLVAENMLSSNTGAAIRATGGDNRLESNNCTSNGLGFDVIGAGNIIVRNTCSGNANNWAVSAGNYALVVSATSGGIITGNSGGASLGSTDPNANFTY